MAGTIFARGADTLRGRIARLISQWGWRTAVAGGLLVTPVAGAVEPAAEAEATAQTTDAAFAEDSVLIATRKVEDAADEAQAGLEPISQHADQEPELADPPATSNKQAATESTPAVEAKVAEAKVEKTDGVEATDLAEEAAEKTGADKSEAPRVAFRKPTKTIESTDAAEATDTKPAETDTAASKPTDSTVVSETIEPKKLDSADVANVFEATPKKPAIEAAKFHGIVPGVSTADELLASWGEPVLTDPVGDGKLLTYELAPFAGVEALVEDGLVTLVRVKLETQQEPNRLARRLRLDKIETVEILDEQDDLLVGIAYPEKGIVLMLAEQSVAAPPETPQFVTHMVIQALDAEAFALRADQAPYEAFKKRLADLELALTIDPTDAYTNWQMAEMHRLIASPDKAEPAAALAMETDPETDAYRLCHAQCLADQGNLDEAVLETRAVLDSEAAPDVVKAGALHLMGVLASKGDSSIADKAIGFHTMAIDIADKLATSSDRRERHTAKRLLVDAHLAVSREIARRKYARKSEIVAQWIARASGLAEEMIDSDDGSLELRLIVAREALATLADLKPAKDPAPWIKEAEETASQLLADSTDRLFRSRVEWQLGEAYFHALRIEHARKAPEQGIEYGKRAIENLQSSAVVGEPRPDAEELVGRLFFHIGAAYAVHKQDHAEAVTWYDKAYPLVTAETPTSELAVPRRKGETLVSMAVSYWTEGNRDRGVDLTEAGAELMELAVAGGVLEEKALAVPYGNLATMHKKLGNRDESAKFAKLARGARGSSPSFAEAVQQKSAPKQAATPQRPATTNRSAAKPQRSAAKPQATPQRVASRPQPTTKPAAKPSSKPAAERVPSAADEPATPTRSTTRRRTNTRKPGGRVLLR
ncbi:MAG: hypothetical protein AAF589_03230 [Planctomycetota bacterium]